MCVFLVLTIAFIALSHKINIITEPEFLFNFRKGHYSFSKSTKEEKCRFKHHQYRIKDQKLKYYKLCKKALSIGIIKEKLKSQKLVVGNRTCRDRLSNIFKM